MRLFGWFRKDPNAPPPPEPIKPHHWLRVRRGKLEKAPPRWVQRTVRCKPTFVDHRGTVTVAIPMDALHAPLGIEFIFKDIPERYLRMWFEPVSQEESDYLEKRVDFYQRVEFKLDQEAFLRFADQTQESYTSNFPRPKVQHVEGHDNMATQHAKLVQ